MCCTMYWNRLQQVKGQILREEEALDHLIPGVLQRFIHGKEI